MISFKGPLFIHDNQNMIRANYKVNKQCGYLGHKHYYIQLDNSTDDNSELFISSYKATSDVLTNLAKLDFPSKWSVFYKKVP